ncbi:sulfite exporter TauE/SafE family protein [Enterococcus sp. BWB1-3]|uniref:sulfite exporter TauE/SafE family protein n=1 Tax=Enterococcus sp. BWB1-3 TaxID=2787713 RepID=UPI0019237480|nr:sulfite exporter TauE/SafE family protein [Enterococcus sp. BWB1-3]MBL1230072.1 sulfite exporter TauE/SafE family protein [Enterococcus sp. BWB1-3]
MTIFLILLICLFNSFFLFYFIKDITKNYESLKIEKGSPIVYSIIAFFSMFLSTFGISDFAINTIVYRKLKYFPDRLIPATLNTEGTIPLFVMSLIYINYVHCDPITLICLIFSQTLGSLHSPRLSMRTSDNRIKLSMGIGLLVASILIFLNLNQVIPVDGQEYGLRGWKLFISIILLFIYGMLNNFGIGSFAPTMATIYLLGMNPLVAFPIMMSACTLSFVVGSIQFVNKGFYSRKATLIFSVIGSAGVLFAGLIVKNINLSILKWIMVFVLIMASISLFSDVVKNSKKLNNFS